MSATIKTKRAIKAAYVGPKSKCTCGHAGDGTHQNAQGDYNMHAGMLGHGACTVKGCPCFKFTWADFLPAFTATVG